MRHTSHLLAPAVLLFVMAVQSVAAQTAPEVWRNFLQRVKIGSELNVRLNDGRRIRATLVDVREDAVLLQRKTRIPVAIEAVPYDAIVRIEPRKAGQSPAKAIAIGAATGVGVFFGIMALLFAVVGD
jgi:hypothetical protein